MLRTITKHFRRLRHEKRGVSNVIVVMLSLVLIVVVVSNVVLWGYQMNQFDWEKMQEKIEISNVESVKRSWWFTNEKEYIVNVGSYLNGTYTDTWVADNIYETFREESSPLFYNPSGYTLGESTKYVSGTARDLVTDNGAYMVFRSYSSVFSAQTVYAHRESTIIAGTSYYQVKLNNADAFGINLEALASTTGRKLLGRFIYPLTGITEIPANTWTLYYRAYKTGPLTVAHCDVDIVIRKSDGNIRTSIATDVANSVSLDTSWSTVSSTYSWSHYVIADETDFLEVDYYAHVTNGQANKHVYLRTDDSSLPVDDQTRLVGIMLPSTYAVEVELAGSSSIQDWQSLTWTFDSAFTIGNVNVTLQLYNYNASQYPTMGDGYISYISSSTSNTDEAKSQTISLNPTNFRSLAGEWRIKILAVKETISQFDLEVDWVEFKVTSQNSYTLDIRGEFILDLSIFPLAYIHSIEIQILYRANDSLENWSLKAYNWTEEEYSYAGFNSTEHYPSTEFTYYEANLTSAWQSYVQSNGMIRAKFCDKEPDSNQTTIDIDFWGVRIIIDGAKFQIKNKGSTTSRIVAIWVINATTHQRYGANFFLNSGEKADYIRADIFLPMDNFTVKVVTERGNIGVFGSEQT